MRYGIICSHILLVKHYLRKIDVILLHSKIEKQCGRSTQNENCLEISSPQKRKKMKLSNEDEYVGQQIRVRNKIGIVLRKQNKKYIIQLEDENEEKEVTITQVERAISYYQSFIT